MSCGARFKFLNVRYEYCGLGIGHRAWYMMSRDISSFFDRKERRNV
jgi:hypothetical protein